MIDRLAEVAGRPVSRETFDQIERYVDLLREEAVRQNLISRSTLDSLWERHIFDSAQLVRFEPHPGATWVDIGSGAGLPGIVIGLLITGPVVLVEPRRLRAEFLDRVVTQLGLAPRVRVACTRIEAVEGAFDVITARAVAPLGKLLGISTHLSTRNTVWALPKGRSAQSELVEARGSWQCEAEIVPSRTDPGSEILVLRSVRARGKR